MDALTGAPSHLLLNRKDNADNHSTRKAKQGGGASAFASYGFGPLDLPDQQNKAGTQSKKPVTGAGLGTNPLKGPDVGWLTHLAVSEHKR